MFTSAFKKTAAAAVGGLVALFTAHTSVAQLAPPVTQVPSTSTPGAPITIHNNSGAGAQAIISNPQQIPGAYAPSMLVASYGNCSIGVSVSLGVPYFSVGFGKTEQDKDCLTIQTAIGMINAAYQGQKVNRGLAATALRILRGVDPRIGDAVDYAAASFEYCKEWLNAEGGEIAAAATRGIASCPPAKPIQPVIIYRTVVKEVPTPPATPVCLSICPPQIVQPPRAQGGLTAPTP